MQPHRVQQICRSSNRFTPSIVLWQHFVLPCRSLRQLRLSSTASKATSDTDAPQNGNAELPPPSAVVSSEQPESGNAGQDNYSTSTATRGSGNLFRKHYKKIPKKELERLKEAERTAWPDQVTDQVKPMSIARNAFRQDRDYRGVFIHAETKGHSILPSNLPWAVPLDPQSKPDAPGRLALEIEKFHVYAKPNRAEAIARRQVIEQVRAEVRELFPHHTLEVFGSERTGLSLALSDIDLRLIRPGDTSDNTSQKPPEPEDRKRLLADLQALLVKKFKKNSANYAKPKLLHARYPLIATQDRQSGLDLQVVLSNDTSISRDTMRRYMKTFPYLRETYTLIRTIFDTRGLSDVFRGGFGSYSIFMMLVAALVHNPPKRPDPASALFRFLQFWSEFDPASKGISIEPPEFFDKKAHPVLPPKTQSEITSGERKPLPDWMLSLRDPADEFNDLGRKGLSIKHVTATMKGLYSILRTRLRINTASSLLLPLVGDIYSLHLERRRKLTARGESILRDMQTSLAETAKQIREDDSRTPEESGNTDLGNETTSVSEMPSANALGGDDDSRKADDSGKTDVSDEFTPAHEMPTTDALGGDETTRVPLMPSADALEEDGSKKPEESGIPGISDALMPTVETPSTGAVGEDGSTKPEESGNTIISGEIISVLLMPSTEALGEDLKKPGESGNTDLGDEDKSTFEMPSVGVLEVTTEETPKHGEGTEESVPSKESQ